MYTRIFAVRGMPLGLAVSSSSSPTSVALSGTSTAFTSASPVRPFNLAFSSSFISILVSIRTIEAFLEVMNSPRIAFAIGPGVPGGTLNLGPGCRSSACSAG